MNTPQHNRRAPSSPQLMKVPALPQIRVKKPHTHNSNPNPPACTSSSAPSPLNSTAITPFNPVEEKPVNPVNTNTATKKDKFSINEIKQLIDRMGGIDGIVETISKIQKVMQSVSQVAPVAKLLMGSLLPSRKKNGQNTVDFKKEKPSTKMSYKRRPRKHPARKVNKPSSNKLRRRSYTAAHHQ